MPTVKNVISANITGGSQNFTINNFLFVVDDDEYTKIQAGSWTVGAFSSSEIIPTAGELVESINSTLPGHGINFQILPFPNTPYWEHTYDIQPAFVDSQIITVSKIPPIDIENLGTTFNEKEYTTTSSGAKIVNARANTQGIASVNLTQIGSSISGAIVGPNTIGSGIRDTSIAYQYIILPSSAINDQNAIISADGIRFIITISYGVTPGSKSGFYATLFLGKMSFPPLLNYTPTPEPGPGSGDPYAPGGTSGTGGGAGSFDASSDPVDFSQLPTLSAVSAGFISLFNPTNAELQSLAAKIWSTDFLDALTRFFSDPADLIIGLSIVPVIPPTGGKVEVQAGFIPTGVFMNKITTQYVALSCGSVQVVPFYDAALDYSPFTKLSVFLPFIGVRSLDIDECMGQTLAINYNIDLLTGSCVAEIKSGNAVLYTFNGTVSSEIPTSSRSFDSLVSAGIQAVAALGTAVATGGGSTAAAAISGTANAIMSAKPEIIRSGNSSSTAGLLAGKTPYLIYQIPRQSMPEYNNTFEGYPANITATLGDLSGFTQVSTIHIEGVPGTDGELTELENLLRGGVIL